MPNLLETFAVVAASCAIQAGTPPSKLAHVEETRSFPEPRKDHLIDVTEFVAAKARTATSKSGATETIPERHVWFWTTTDAVEKAAMKIGCIYRSSGSVIENSPPATVRLVQRTLRSHEKEMTCSRGSFSFPDSYMSVSSCSADGKAYAINFDLCPDQATRSSKESDDALPDPCLRYVKKILLTHAKHLRNVFEALVSDEKARARFDFVLTDLTGDAKPTAWIRTCETTSSLSADEPLWGPPMLHAQLDATMWVDLQCAGYGPVVLTIAGDQPSTYADLCSTAKARDDKK